MKITAGQLRKIISEEVSKLILEYESSIVRKGDELYVVDDDGNEEYYGDVEGSDYEHLRNGESEPYQVGTGYGSGGYHGGYSGGRSRYGGRRRY